MQQLSDLNIAPENKGRFDYDYKVAQKVLVRNNGIFRKAESRYLKDPWTITSVHTNGTIRVQCGNKLERINIWRITSETRFSSIVNINIIARYLITIQ
jgi:hypothetical protein